MAAWYVSSAAYTAVTQWAALTSYSIGDLRRQLAAPSVGNERVFRCTTAGVSLGSEPTWNLGKGATTTDGALLVWTEVTGDSAYNWTAPHARIANAISWGAAGDTYYLSSDHAETQSTALTITFKGSTTTPDRCLSVNRAGSVPPVAADLTTGAAITTTGASALIIGGSFYAYGITFNCATGATGANLTASNANPGFSVYENCTFKVVGTGSTNRLTAINSASARCEWRNCTVSFGATGQGIGMSGRLVWINTPSAIQGATLPTTLFPLGSTSITGSILSGVDLSALSGKTMFAAGFPNPIDVVGCRFPSSFTVIGAPTAGIYAGPVRVIGCNSASSAEKNEIYAYAGVLTTETVIVRTAGASDGNTAYSYKIVTSANAKRDFPLETFEGVLWNNSTGSSKTLTIHTVTDNVTLKDDEIWVEVEYLGSSATPVATLITDAAATVLTAGANQADDSGEAWTTTGLGTPVKQKLEVTFTPQMAGLIRWRVRVAKASTTVYVCPKPDLA